MNDGMEESRSFDPVFRLYDLIPSGVIVLGPDFSILFWNACMADWTGITPGEAVGLNLFDRYPALKNTAVITRIQQLFEGGPAVLFSSMFHPHLFPCTLPNGTLRVQKTSFIPMNYNDEIYALVIIEDVSELTRQVKAYRDMKKVSERQLEELKKAQDAVFQANKKLNLLNSITRHDIMNNLMVLNGYLYLSKDIEPGDPKIMQFIEKEINAAEGIKTQIQFTSFYQDIGVKSAVWQDIAGTIRSAIPSLITPGIDLTIDLPAMEIFADPLLQKVFYNLVENSIRHGETITHIKFSCLRSGRDCLIIYEDDGPGVPDEVKEKIFRREFFKHTGFGLFLSREILAITNISICENGVAGKGARFEITVPEGAYRPVKDSA
jgi:signal transduction histidine kinase